MKFTVEFIMPTMFFNNTRAMSPIETLYVSSETFDHAVDAHRYLKQRLNTRMKLPRKWWPISAKIIPIRG